MNKTKHLPLFTLQQAIRDFFRKEDFLDVLTPPAVANPGMEVHIHPFKLKSAHKSEDTQFYLHTSPEFHMKSLLSEGHKKIFTLSYCFRDEPNSSTHRPQFLMLEWYRANEHYTKIMDDTEKLVNFCHRELKTRGIPVIDSFSFKKKTISEIFIELLKIDILDYLDKPKLYELIRKDFSHLHLGEESNYSWDDLYFLLFLNEVEPKLDSYDFLILYEFPHHLKALSTIKEDNPKVCERFELYYKGIELCNCFNELTNPEEQRDRFKEQATEKKNLYGYELPEATLLFDALERGLPTSSGVALGVERLLMSLTNTKDVFFD